MAVCRKGKSGGSGALTGAALGADLKREPGSRCRGAGRDRTRTPLWAFLASLCEEREQPARLPSIPSAQSPVSPPPEPPVPRTVQHESSRQGHALPS